MKTLLKRAGLTAVGFMIVLVVMQIAFGNSSAPPAGKTGSPGENRCTQCHSGTAGTGSVSMVFGNNETQYVPGQLYTITTNVTDATKLRFGFQMTALAGGVGPTVGVFAVTNTTNTSSQTATISGSLRKYMGHKAANSNQDWSFHWTAPATDVGPITFFLVGLAANNNNSDNGDKVYFTTFTITATPPPPPVAAASAIDTSICVNGTVSFSDQSTNSPSSHEWSFPGGSPATSTAANPVVSYVTPGSYDVTLISGNVSGSDTITLVNYIQVYALPTTSAVAQDAACFGESSGNIDLTPAGAGGFSFLWSNGATVEDPNNLAAGIYNVTVTDQNGCVNTDSFTVGQPTAVQLTLSSQPSPCGLSTGSATVAATGGNAPYTYLWTNGNTTAASTGLAAGSYDVSVTDANGCVSIGSVGVSNIGAPSGAVVSVNPTCNGDNDGTIDLTITGGQAPFTYLWSNGATTQDVTGLAAGSYDVTVTSSNGCVLSQVVVITEPAPLATTVGHTPEISGNDGTATVNVTGGNGNYSYLWSNGGTTQTISGLNAGSYTVTISDSLGCHTTATVDVELVISVAGTMHQDLFKVGPNPFHEYFTLTPNVSITGSFAVHLLDIEGRIVFGTSVQGKGIAPIRITPGPMTPGVYMLMIQTAKGKMHRKVIHTEF